MACQTAFCGRFRTPLHVWSQELDDTTISRLCCISCVGCLSVNESSTRLHAWYASSWLVKHPHTEPTTSNSLWTVIAVSYVQPPPGHAQQLRRSKLQCCRPPRVKQFTAAPATRHELCALQASTENISIRELVNHGALWLLLNFVPWKFSYLLIFLLTYLLTYLWEYWRTMLKLYDLQFSETETMHFWFPCLPSLLYYCPMQVPEEHCQLTSSDVSCFIGQ